MAVRFVGVAKDANEQTIWLLPPHGLPRDVACPFCLEEKLGNIRHLKSPNLCWGYLDDVDVGDVASKPVCDREAF